MKRLYTAFVSSTFLDLRHERTLVADQLLNLECVPLGMEYFPSTGADQWQLILESLDAADFCLFIIAGRYGSIVPELGISWTHREYQEALLRGKPLVVLMRAHIHDLPADCVESDPVKQTALEQFRSEVQGQVGCRYYTNDVELLTGLHGSVSALKAKGQIQGWVPAGARPVIVQETDFDRTYEILEVEHYYSKSDTDPDVLDLSYRCRRRIRGNTPDGLTTVAQDFSHASEALLPFDEKNQPILSIERAERTDVGGVRLAEQPRKKTGAVYVRDITLMPPLGLDEVVDFTLAARLAGYRYAYCEDLLGATLDDPLGPRVFDFSSRIISYPTKRLILRAFLPHDTKAVPAGPQVGRAGTIEHAASVELVRQGCYREWESVVDGKPGMFTELRVDNPRLHRRYRITWTLPYRPR